MIPPDGAAPAAAPLPDGMQSAMEDPSYAAQGEQQPAAPERDKADAAMISAFEADQRFPKHTKEVIDEIQELRSYVNHDVMVPKTKQAVAENLILRNQYIRMGQTWAKDPDLSCTPRKLIAPKVKFPGAPPPAEIAQQGNMDLANAVAQDAQAQQDYQAFVESLGLFGQTIELVVKKFYDDAKGATALEGGIQDVQTDGFWWLKVSWQESLGHDPIGTRRASDFEDIVAKLRSLAADFAAGEFDEQDKRYAEYLDLANTVRDQLMAEQWAQNSAQQAPTGETDPNTGRPGMEPVDPRDMAWKTGERPPEAAIAEIPRQRCFRMDPVDPRDLRRDWSITRPEDWRKSRWVAERVWMTDDEIKATFDLDDEQLRDALASNAGASSETTDDLGRGDAALTTEDPDDRSDVERSSRNGQRAVWERWDRSANRRYVWIQGCSSFIVNEVPSVVSKLWFPYFLLWFNRVTGRFEPVSDAKLQRPLNDEYNLLRTHDRQARRASYNKYIVARNLLSTDEKEKLESCPPEGVIEVRRAKEVAKYLHTVVGSNYNAMLYDTGKVRQALDETANIPSAARGNTAASKFATTDAIANAVMNEQSDRYRGKIEGFCYEVFYHMADIAVQVLPEANAKAIAGPGAVWPMMDRETLWSNLQLTIEAGSTGKPDQQRKLSLYQSMAGICQGFGIGLPGSRYNFKPIPILSDLFTVMGISVEPEKYIEETPMAPPMMGPPGPNGPGPGGPPMPPPHHLRGPPPHAHHGAPPAGPHPDDAHAQEVAAGHGVEIPSPRQPPGGG